MADMANDANHNKRAITHVRHPKLLPEGALLAKSLLRQHLVNHDDQLVARTILLVKKSPLPQRNSHDIQIFRRHACRQCLRLFILRRHIR